VERALEGRQLPRIQDLKVLNSPDRNSKITTKAARPQTHLTSHLSWLRFHGERYPDGEVQYTPKGPVRLLTLSAQCQGLVAVEQSKNNGSYSKYKPPMYSVDSTVLVNIKFLCSLHKTFMCMQSTVDVQICSLDYKRDTIQSLGSRPWRWMDLPKAELVSLLTSGVKLTFVYESHWPPSAL
jgi:hypothetical protein